MKLTMNPSLTSLAMIRSVPERKASIATAAMYSFWSAKIMPASPLLRGPLALRRDNHQVPRGAEDEVGYERDHGGVKAIDGRTPATLAQPNAAGMTTMPAVRRP